VSQHVAYDRRLLLHGAKRNSVLELWEVERYGTESYGDPDYVSIYGLPPREWYAKGIRLFGRTAVECTRDELADAIGRDIASVAMKPRPVPSLVIDPFAGSGNTLYWILRHLPEARGVGCELDATVFQLTARNLEALRLPVEVVNSDYLAVVSREAASTEDLIVAFIAPPWGEALKDSGLDLRGTQPPITETVAILQRTFSGKRLLCAIQVHEVIDPRSLAELQPRFDWSALRIYDLNSPGQNHGVFLGTMGWVPN
jgi:16S rRNA G966 N2-methylase RsmD